MSDVTLRDVLPQYASAMSNKARLWLQRATCPDYAHWPQYRTMPDEFRQLQGFVDALRRDDIRLYGMHMVGPAMIMEWKRAFLNV